MIELRWLLDPKHRDYPKDLGRPVLDCYTLQYRFLVGYMDAGGAFNVSQGNWSKWIDVPYVSEDDDDWERFQRSLDFARDDKGGEQE